jgi:hypothetical protein
MPQKDGAMDLPTSFGYWVRRRRKALDLTGKTEIAELPALLSRCSAFLGNDSGAMHVAAAVGLPVVAVFGPTDPFGTAIMGIPGPCQSNRKNSSSGLMGLVMSIACSPDLALPFPMMAGAGGGGRAAAAAARAAVSAARAAAKAAAARAVTEGIRPLEEHAAKMQEAAAKLEELIQQLESSAGRAREALQQQVTKLTQDIWGHIREIVTRW